MDDKTKVQLCRKIIEDFNELSCVESGEYSGMVWALMSVLDFERENDDD